MGVFLKEAEYSAVETNGGIIPTLSSELSLVRWMADWTWVAQTRIWPQPNPIWLPEYSLPGLQTATISLRPYISKTETELQPLLPLLLGMLILSWRIDQRISPKLVTPQRSPHPNATMIGVWASAYEFGEEVHNHSVYNSLKEQNQGWPGGSVS